MSRVCVQGRDLCRCVAARGLRLLPNPSCPACGGTGGVGRALPTAAEVFELWAGGWALGPEGWVHELYGLGRWRTALALARDDARRREVRRPQPRRNAA